MAAIAAILDFGPSPKSNGMILGPYLTPPPSFVEIRWVFPEYCSQTNKQTERGENRNLHPSSMAEVNKSQRTEEENKELTSLLEIFASRLLTSVSGRRYKRESGDKEDKEGKDYIIDDVGVIDFN